MLQLNIKKQMTKQMTNVFNEYLREIRLAANKS